MAYTVGERILHQLVVNPIIYKVSYISGGHRRFLPSTVLRGYKLQLLIPNPLITLFQNGWHWVEKTHHGLDINYDDFFLLGMAKPYPIKLTGSSEMLVGMG